MRLFLPLQVLQPVRELWLLVPDLRVFLVPFLLTVQALLGWLESDHVPKEHPFVLGGMAPGVPHQLPEAGAWGQLDMNRDNLLSWCHCQAQGGWKAGWWHQCHSPQAVYQRGHDLRELERFS